MQVHKPKRFRIGDVVRCPQLGVRGRIYKITWLPRRGEHNYYAETLGDSPIECFDALAEELVADVGNG